MFPQILGDAMETCVVTPAAVHPSGKQTSKQRETGILQPPVKYGPMLMKVAPGYAMLNRYVAFNDNMDVVLKLVNEIHSRMFDIPDFEMVNI
ncbi:hypothetical protein ACET3Z_010459 [Daucus carota]